MPLADSGRRHTFETGAQREKFGDDEVPRPVLKSPIADRLLALHFARGAKKYEERNWEKGIPLSNFVDSMERHLLDLKEGVDNGEDHAVALLWNIHCFVHTREMIARGLLPQELDDMPNYTYEGVTTD